MLWIRFSHRSIYRFNRPVIYPWHTQQYTFTYYYVTKTHKWLPLAEILLKSSVKQQSEQRCQTRSNFSASVGCYSVNTIHIRRWTRLWTFGFGSGWSVSWLAERTPKFTGTLRYTQSITWFTFDIRDFYVVNFTQVTVGYWHFFLTLGALCRELTPTNFILLFD